MSMLVRSVNIPDAGAPAPLRLAAAAGPVEIGLRGFGGSGDSAWAHALYAYPTIHHAFWRTVRAQARVAAPDDPIRPGLFDEHLALDGVQESQLWVGDLLRFADCVLVVAGPRLPDERFNETLGFPQAAKMVAESRWCGCWLGVRMPGRIVPGESFELVPGPRATGLVELFRARVAAKAR